MVNDNVNGLLEVFQACNNLVDIDLQLTFFKVLSQDVIPRTVINSRESVVEALWEDESLEHTSHFERVKRLGVIVDFITSNGNISRVFSLWLQTLVNGGEKFIPTNTVNDDI
ncbi:hypothetical protein WICPIJ_002111 [Wickerhamomyces pijperi]|uniref:Uncharacterized protein n=1 Tax=Wickerhamomyces pijperi TaxID=599730 RepID=A0A9P8QCA8_WICPI|nr:hypothetical protein WICPIJ_002111 [Wickerhamomyces pijperi]